MTKTNDDLAAALGARTPRQWLALVAMALVAWLLSGILFVLSLAAAAQQKGLAAAVAQADGWVNGGLVDTWLSLAAWLASTVVLVGLVDSAMPRRPGRPQVKR